MNWNQDISAAPRGKMVHSTRTVGDRVHEISDFVADHIWAASKCGKVIKSYWIPPVGKAAGRWSGFATGEAPIAWQRFVVPKHPFEMEGSTESSFETGREEAENARKANPETEDGSVTHAGAGESPATLYFEDCGSGA